MEEKTYIKQPNHVSTARFPTTALEKDIIYHIVGKLQEKMSKDLNGVFKEQEISLELKKIESNNNYGRVKKAVKSLASKFVEFETQIPGSKAIEQNLTSLISGLKRVDNSKYISFMVPSSSVGFFCYIGGGYTTFQKVIAINLNSIYSKLFYELCCRWYDKGGFSTNIEKLKKYFNISDKYKQIAHLRNKVLNVAEKELKEKADFYFTYTLYKKERKYTDIKIKIHKNTPNQETYFGINHNSYLSVYNFLNIYFPNHLNNKALHYSDQLAESGQIENANQRFKRLVDDLDKKNKNKKDILNLLNVVILPEFGLKTEHKKPNHTYKKRSDS